MQRVTSGAMRTPPLPLLACLVGATIGLLAPVARANGVFPSAGQIAIDPADANHILVRTTYGILTTRAGGEPWDWICETGVGYSSLFHPAIALLEDGTAIAGLGDGLAVAHTDACSWNKASGPIDGAYVVDVSVEKSAPSHAVAITSNGAAGAARFFTSEDNAVTWTQAGVDLPIGFIPLSIDVAPSDPTRVYVSALAGGAGTLKGSLLISPDRGATWQPISVPLTDGDHAPYIGAIDPVNPDRLYLRTDGSPGHLFVFDHSTDKFEEIYAGQGYLRGFALSPDGQTLLVGGSSDGILRASASSLVFEKVSTVSTRCLTWTADGVYTCATEFSDGFTVGLSKDQGATFEPIMHLACVRGPLDCPAPSSVGKACPQEWDAVATLIGQSSCQGGGGSAGAGGSSTGGAGAGGASSTGGASRTSTTSGGGSISTDLGGDRGCACSVGSRSDPRGAPSSLALGTVVLLFLRGRRRASPPA